MRALFVTILLLALVLPIGHAPASPPSDISAADLQTQRNLAVQGNSTAQYSLGVLYRSGHGVPQNDVRAYMWFSLAAAHSTGNTQKPAADTRDKIASLMTPVQIAEAQKLAREWKPKMP